MNINFDSACRICLEQNGISDIFSHSKSFKRKASHEMMDSLFSFSVDRGDGLPSKICYKCCSKLSSAYKLKLLAEESHRKLLNFFSEMTETVREVEKVDDGGAGEVVREEGGAPDQESDEDKPLAPAKVTEVCYRDEGISNNNRKRKGGGGGVCERCGKCVADVRLHARVHGAARSIPCGEGGCPKVFSNHSGRLRHRAVHHLGQTYFCSICNKSTILPFHFILLLFILVGYLPYLHFKDLKSD